MVGNRSSRSVTRLLVIVGAVGFIGAAVGLVQAPLATATPGLNNFDSSVAALLIDHSVVKDLGDDQALEQGASVAAYASSLDPSTLQDLAPTPTATNLLDDNASSALHRSSTRTLEISTPVPGATTSSIENNEPLEPGASVAAYGL